MKKEEVIAQKENSRKMWKGICSECKNGCEVPFEPIKGKPIRCLDCFKKHKPRKNFRESRKIFDATCAKCGKNCQVPFKPNGKKPVLCRECYNQARDSLKE